MELIAVGNLKLDKAGVAVVPGPMGQEQVGVDGEGELILRSKAPDAVKSVYAEVPEGELFEVVVRTDGDKEQVICSMVGPKPEKGKAVVVAIRVRARTDANPLGGE